CCASGFTNPRTELLVKRLLLGFAGGLLGGLLGSLVGSCLFGGFDIVSRSVSSRLVDFLGRIVGWTLIRTRIGAGVGGSEGIVDHSVKKRRNGLIGGVRGGFLGGFFFGVLTLFGGSITSRAVSFVLLGLSIGLLIGLAQVILKEAWLTVEAGFRPGRQL